MTFNEFYSQTDNPFYIRMKEILDYRQQNKLTYINSVKDRPDDYIKCQKHHIIPRCWYRHHGYEIDNSKENIIYLTPGEHLEIHVLMREYFKSINDLDMYYAMALAIDKMTNGTSEWIENVVNNTNEKDYYLKEYENNIDIAAEATAYRYKKMTPEERIKLSQQISDGWKNMDKNAYDKLCDKRVEIGKMLWIDPNYKTGSDEWRKNQSESQKRAWENKSEAQKELEKQKRCETWKNMPEEKKQQLRDEQVKIQTDRWNKKSKKDKKEHGKKISQAYQNKSEEKKKLHQKRKSEALKRYYKNLSKEEKEKISQERKSRRWMSNDKLMICRYVQPKDIQKLLDQAWVFGHKIKIYKKLKSLTQQDI